MKKHVLLLGMAALPLLTACLKNNPAGFPYTPPLRITDIKGRNNYAPGRDSIIITYNNAGNPIRIVRGETSTGSPSFQLRYDRQNRLRDIIGVYNGRENIGDYFEIWHRYHYDRYNQVIADTTYSFGVIGQQDPLPRPGQPAVTIGNIFSFSYDSQHRINRSSMEVGPVHTITTTWYYNSAGNAYRIHTRDVWHQPDSLPYPDTDRYPVYDNKVNFRRLHPVWQLIDLDYSRNNPFQATAYNIYGLPLDIPIHPKEYLNILGINSFSAIDEIKYAH
ncbi:hypothetical protein [Chitinophaga nivalis]|uniref:DUF4595 domain-containing protein n=1 Tax=Chitinophaga nivalis TaxID=2991709 RepID=A0ABT3IF30_9BACT|nr:hypothetical protein [Chitinophaga nivalis]MCW3467735.1 hypothetical protein [Chitinophaga nivalis]MCW3482573.1 hypothetical protein [Chitinophaga nivalis]